MYTMITPILLSERLNKLIIKASICVHVRAIPSIRAILPFYFPFLLLLLSLGLYHLLLILQITATASFLLLLPLHLSLSLVSLPNRICPNHRISLSKLQL